MAVQWPRAVHLVRATVAVVAVGVACTVGGFVLARDWEKEGEQDALVRQATATATLLQALANEVGGILNTGSAIAEATEGDPARFRSLMAGRLGNTSVVSASLVHLNGDKAVATATVGADPSILISSLTPSEVSRLREVAMTGGIRPVTTRVIPGARVALLAAPGTADGRNVVTAELRFVLEDTPSLTGANVQFAVYAGIEADNPRAVLSASTTRLPLVGNRVVEPIQILGAPLTLVVAADGPLVHGIRGDVQWLVLAFGIALSAAAAVILEARKRRTLAETTRRSLTEQNERLQEVDRLKDDLIATVSHELRTPLTSITGYAELLAECDSAADSDKQLFLEVIQRNSRRLLNLVDDLLLAARIDAGGIRLEVDDLDLARLTSECVEGARPRAEQAKIALSLELTEIEVVSGDRERLGQLLDNLLSNAIKFTPEGGHINVRLSRENDAAVIEVVDTGMGVPEAELPHLFERFFRSSNATESAIQGTGLGLAICRAIAEAHGGTITAESRKDRGTTIRFSLPLARTMVQSPQQRSSLATPVG